MLDTGVFDTGFLWPTPDYHGGRWVPVTDIGLSYRTWFLQLKWTITLVAEMQRDRTIIDVQFKSKIVEYKNEDCINGKQGCKDYV